MSAQYIAYLNDKECGPIDFEALLSYASVGTITDETYVRYSDKSEWSTWKAVQILKTEEDARKAKSEKERLAQYEEGPTRPPSELEAVREKLRSQTAYPILRMCLIVLLVLSGIALALSVLALSDPNLKALAMAGIAGALGSIFSTLILGVLLDIADASLRKID
jgi:hypothetical protein